MDAPGVSPSQTAEPNLTEPNAAGPNVQELAPEFWYAVFLSGFLIGLLVLGGLWIWLNIWFV